MSSPTEGRRLLTFEPLSGALVDVAIAAVLLAGSLGLIAHGTAGHTRPGQVALPLAGALLAASSTVPLVAWRRFPLAVFLVTAAASVPLASLGYPLNVMLGPTAALYLLAASRTRRNPWSRRTTAIVVALLVAYLGAAAAERWSLLAAELFLSSLAWATAWLAGERSRLRREQMAELSERVARSEREAERERQLAVAEERARIARDLHDSAGHAISVIAVRAGAARLRHHEDPGRSLVALEAIEELARRTVGEINQIVGTLRVGRSANGAVEAPLGLASVGSLIANHRAAGLEVTFETSGEPRPLGGLTDQAAYRILQEALTNAARHGAGSASVELAFGDAAIDLTVSNPVLMDAAPQFGGGHGLIGMRERATLLGGSIDAERSNGSYRVRARLPYGGTGT